MEFEDEMLQMKTKGRRIFILLSGMAYEGGTAYQGTIASEGGLDCKGDMLNESSIHQLTASCLRLEQTFKVAFPGVLAPVKQTILESLMDKTSHKVSSNKTFTSYDTVPNPVPRIVTSVPPAVLPDLG